MMILKATAVLLLCSAAAAITCTGGKSPCGHSALDSTTSDTLCCPVGSVCRKPLGVNVVTTCVKEKVCASGLSPCGASSPTDLTSVNTLTDRTANTVCCTSTQYCKVISGKGGNISVCTPKSSKLTCASKCGHSYYDNSIADGFCCFNNSACVPVFSGYGPGFTRTLCDKDVQCAAGREQCGYAVDRGSNAGFDLGRSAATTCCKTGQVCSFKKAFGKAGAIGVCVTLPQAF